MAVVKKNNRWYVVLYMPPYGQQWFAGGTTKKEAELKEAELKLKKEAGTIGSAKYALGSFLDQWLETVKSNLASSTYESYVQTVNLHLKPALGNIALGKLKPIDIQRYYTAELNGGRKDNKKTVGSGLSSTTVLYHHRVLHRALETAVKWGLISRNPADMVDPPRKAKKEINTLNEKQIHILLSGIKDEYLYMPVFLAVMTGMRRGEILGLRWRDVDLQNGIIYVTQALYQRKAGIPTFTEPKTPQSKRAIQISDAVIKALEKHKAEQDKNRSYFTSKYAPYDLVCCMQDGKPINPESLSSYFADTTKRLGFPVRFHDLRHTHASLLLKAGINPKIVSERLGHNSIEITLNTYSHVMPGLQKEAADKFEEMLKNGTSH